MARCMKKRENVIPDYESLLLYVVGGATPPFRSGSEKMWARQRNEPASIDVAVFCKSLGSVMFCICVNVRGLLWHLKRNLGEGKKH